MMSSYLVNRVTIVLERRYTMQRIQHVCKRSRGKLLVLTRAFSVNNEIYITFLLILKRKVYLAEMNNLPLHHGAGA